MSILGKLFDKADARDSGEMTPEKVGDVIIKLLISDPNGWSFDSHNAIYRGVEIWIANRNYADIIIGGMRIGNDRSREEMRRLIDAIHCKQILVQLGVPIEPPPSEGRKIEI